MVHFNHYGNKDLWIDNYRYLYFHSFWYCAIESFIYIVCTCLYCVSINKDCDTNLCCVSPLVLLLLSRYIWSQWYCAWCLYKNWIHLFQQRESTVEQSIGKCHCQTLIYHNWLVYYWGNELTSVLAWTHYKCVQSNLILLYIYLFRFIY